jgi:ZIP family zinc transporter
MLDAVLLGALAQSSLILTGLAVYAITVPVKVVGSIAGYGIGALLGAIAFDLIPEQSSLSSLESALWLLAGAAVFIAADYVVETRLSGGGAKEENPASSAAASKAEGSPDEADGGADAPMGIVVGSVVDGVPESLIFGIGVALLQPVSIPFLAAVFISNIPQALAPSSDLAKAGWKPSRMTLMWGGVVIACGIAAGVGFVVASLLPDAIGARAAAFAAGGLLAMLTNSLVPFAYERAGWLAGVFTVVGFAVAVATAGV